MARRPSPFTRPGAVVLHVSARTGSRPEGFSRRLGKSRKIFHPSGLNYCDALSPSPFSRGLGLIWVKNKCGTTSGYSALLSTPATLRPLVGDKNCNNLFVSVCRPNIRGSLTQRATLDTRTRRATLHCISAILTFVPAIYLAQRATSALILRDTTAIHKPGTWCSETLIDLLPSDAGRRLLPQKLRSNVGDAPPRSDFQEAC